MDGNGHAQPNELRSQAARSLLIRLFRDIVDLAQEEYDLVRTELAQKRGGFVRATWSFVFALALGALALVCLTAAAVAELAIAIGLPLAALAVGLVLAVVAAVLAVVLRRAVAPGGDLVLTHTSAQLAHTDRPVTKTLDEQTATIAWTRRHLEETLAALERKSDLVKPIRDTAVNMGALSLALANIVREDAKTRN
jgi:uncharacterized membrane protein YqjE